MNTNTNNRKSMRVLGNLAWCSQSLRIVAVILLAVAAMGCSTTHYTVLSAPVSPEDTGRFVTANPEIPVRVQITNFEIRKVDTQYPEKEKELFRRHNSVAIPNMLQEFLGTRQVFAEVTRSSVAKPDSTDYVIIGTYDFFERLGTRGREWIPFAGIFGAPINEATIRATLSLQIVESKNGTVVFDKAFPEEHSDRTSIYKRPNVGYLQAAYMGQIASEIIHAISDHLATR